MAIASKCAAAKRRPDAREGSCFDPVAEAVAREQARQQPLSSVQEAADPMPTYASPMPSSRQLQRRPHREAAVVVPDHTAIKTLFREMKHRAHLSDQEIGKRMGCSHQAVNEVSNGLNKLSEQRRRVSVIWMARYAMVCGARLIVEFPEEG